MCGIAVILKRPEIDCPLDTVRRFVEEVAHRGPDGSGLIGLGAAGTSREPEWMAWTVGMGHRRLSIIDLSEAGAQPMSYRNRYWLTYNGEVYNYIELRAELEGRGHCFVSQTDSEVILAAYAEWGSGCFARFRGMWGLALYDTLNDDVTLSRDPLGIKPLYFWRAPGLVAIASEIKQFVRIPGFVARGDEFVVSEYLERGYEDPSRSFFRGVVPLPSGSYLRISVGNLAAGKPVGYWSPEKVKVSVTDPREASERFATKFDECVRIQLRSDVPVGCALSGGLDSSAIAVVANGLRPPEAGPLHTFTATFPGDPADEREFVDAVLARIAATPHFDTPEPDGFLNDLTDFVWHHDEPVGGLSLYAGYCLARLTRDWRVPVTLNGQGGDEILSGYWQSYFLYLRELALGGRWLSLAAHLAGALKSDGNSSLFEQAPLMLRRYRGRSRGRTLVGLRGGSAAPRSAILRKALALRGQARRVGEIRDLFLPRLLKWDDRNLMAFSIEGRYPFLDSELIELCLSFSPELLFEHGWTKWPLRQGLRSLLPEKIYRRRSKFGFEVPQDRWLCGPLRPAIEHWLGMDRPLWNYVERDSVRQVAGETWRLDGRRAEPGQVLFRCFVLDKWLEVFGVA
jgi:asparagine synthase (glutamine-hydrolysing)